MRRDRDFPFWGVVVTFWILVSYVVIVAILPAAALANAQAINREVFGGGFERVPLMLVGQWFLVTWGPAFVLLWGLLAVIASFLWTPFARGRLKYLALVFVTCGLAPWVMIPMWFGAKWRPELNHHTWPNSWS